MKQTCRYKRCPRMMKDFQIQKQFGTGCQPIDIQCIKCMNPNLHESEYLYKVIDSKKIFIKNP